MSFLLLTGCADTESQLPTVQVDLKGTPFTLEVADTPAARERGLMFRDTMSAQHGMLFVFETAQPLAFWMKNTRIPLDLIYLDPQGVIVRQCTMAPYVTDAKDYTSIVPAQYAIEINAGVAKKLGLKDGEKITLPASVLRPATSPTTQGARP